jgi:hypothetical protein
MAISNISVRHICFKQPGDLSGNSVIGDHPNSMTNAVIGHKIIHRLMAVFPLPDNIVNLRHIAVSKEYITGLCAGGGDMVNAVLLFFGAGKFVLFDDVLLVIVYRTGGYQAGLAAAIHDELINIVAGFVFPEQDASLNKRIDIFFCFLVHRLAMAVHAVGQVDLGFSDMQKRIWVTQRFFPGLF